ncbi:MAG: 16S rRNA (uracil(1498)-N(3))-methyltransferase [Acetivibrionales bacterium]|nr:16S rRNA (uracil(1498)-N(3))-methyltransferase [Clostridiaceae bacterium]
MHRFMVAPANIQNDRIILEGDDLKHLRQVLRIEPGDTVFVFDGSGIEYEAIILSMDKFRAIAQIKATFQNEAEPQTHVTLFQGVLKGEKMDLIIQKGVELGVHRIVPVITNRTVVKLNKKDSEKKAERWSKIAREAAKQCRRAYVPEVTEPISFDESLLKAKEFGATLFLYENEGKKCLKETLKCYTINKIEDISLFVGPEGGFTLQEVENCKDLGYDIVGLGKRILRAETAAISVLSIIMYEMGEISI